MSFKRGPESRSPHCLLYNLKGKVNLMMINGEEMKEKCVGEAKNAERKQIPQRIVKLLYARSGCQCAYPGCGEQLFDESNINISEICHIEGVKPGSARYNPELSADEVDDISNLILLCKKHHAAIDRNPNVTVEELKKMKEEHEAWVYSRLHDENGQKFRRKLKRIFQESNFEELFSCQTFDAMFEYQLLEDAHNGCNRIRGLLGKKCALYIPDSMEQRLRKFSNKLEDLLFHVEMYSVRNSEKYVTPMKSPGDPEVEETHKIMNELANEYMALKYDYECENIRN